MKPTVRVNIHPRPRSLDCDYHLPYIGNSYNQGEHITESYLVEFRKHVDPNSRVYLLGCGEPTSRHLSVKKIIEDHYSDIEIEPMGTGYTNPDPLFTNGYTTVTKPAGVDAAELSRQYLEYYPRLQKFSQRYTYEHHSRDHGYFNADKRFWYQYGQDMPAAPSPEHKHLYTIFDRLFEQLITALTPSMEAIGLDEKMLRSKLMLRFSHNPPGVRIKNLVVNRHCDNSIVTAWVYQDRPGGYIDHGQEFEEQAVSIDTVYDNATELLLLPGFDYCDQTGSAIPSTWHSVREIAVDHRTSLVAFIKY